MARLVLLRGPSSESVRVGTFTIPRQTWGVPELAAGFANFGTPWANAGYLLDDAGFVSLRGRVNWTAGALPLTIFTLPQGFRPLQQCAFFTAADPLTATAVLLQVLVTGEVQLVQTGVAAPVAFSLDGCRFDAQL